MAVLPAVDEEAPAEVSRAAAAGAAAEEALADHEVAVDEEAPVVVFHGAVVGVVSHEAAAGAAAGEGSKGAICISFLVEDFDAGSVSLRGTVCYRARNNLLLERSQIVRPGYQGVWTVYTGVIGRALGVSLLQFHGKSDQISVVCTYLGATGRDWMPFGHEVCLPHPLNIGEGETTKLKANPWVQKTILRSFPNIPHDTIAFNIVAIYPDAPKDPNHAKTVLRYPRILVEASRCKHNRKGTWASRG